MRIATLVLRAALVATLAGTSGIAATTAQAAGGAAHGQGTAAATAGACATVTVKATPKVNTEMIPETIKSKVTNCASGTETVTLDQKLAGPFGPRVPATRKWTLTIPAGQTVTKTRSFPYTCCGSYNANDRVYSATGQQLAKASSGFTFA
ncbi:MAG TPA: hypothetical protein VGM53_11945 [Streptosporangiaceae bacterium]|jgi:hypothetical protein